MAQRRIGTVELPVRVARERYFRELTYLELSAWFAGPVKPGTVDRWKAIAPPGALGLVAPWVLTQRQPPPGPRSWPHDASVGDFRDSPHGRAALAEVAKAGAGLGAAHVVFRSPPVFAASAANREQLRRFFGEIATAEAVGAERVWVPDGLWDVRTAVGFAREIGVTCAFDPLIRAPGDPLEIYFDLDVETLYLRISGLGRSGPIRNERHEDLIALLDHYEERPATIVFDSPERWLDARNLKKLLENP